MNAKKNPWMPMWFALVLAGGVGMGIVIGERTGAFGISGRSDSKIRDVMRYVEDNYVDTLDAAALEDKTITGLLEKLDPHSVYITPEEFHEANDPLLGSFEGIGVQFRIESDTVTVITPVAGGPSEKMGIRPGDRIVKVDGQNIAGIKIATNDVMRKLKGPKGTRVDITIFRRGAGGLLDFSITRDVIPTYSLDIAYMVRPGTGYLRLNNFSAKTGEEVREAIGELLGKGMKKLIVDLRGNGGGYLKAASEVADEFLGDGLMVVSTRGAHHKEVTYEATGYGQFEAGEVIILVDEGTASAAEIVAGAVQDHDRGLIIGRRSFGKGLVQEQLDFRDGSALRLTVARYYTPTGRCIQKSYKDGIESYQNDYYHRFMNGELEHSDSIRFPDSLKYRTPKGRTVYGGGGIMPDLFVPLEKDSALFYYNRCMNKGLVYQFAFDYTDKHRRELDRYRDAAQFTEGFTAAGALYDEFTAYAAEKGIKREGKDLARSDHYLKTVLKAYIGRNLFDNKAFYPVINTIDPVIDRAVRALERGEAKF